MEGRKTILVIEDHPVVLEGMVLFLEMQGYQVMGAEGGQRGIEMAYSHEPHLIISDLAMPGLNGWDVLKQLQSDPKTAAIPFVFFSAHGGPFAKERARRMGAAAFVDKGDGTSELLHTVRSVLERPLQH